MINWCLFCSVSYLDCSECRNEVDVDRNTKLKMMIRKYFQQEHSVVEADMKEVIVAVVVVVIVVVPASAAIITFVMGVSTMYTCHRHWIPRHFYAWWNSFSLAPLLV